MKDSVNIIFYSIRDKINKVLDDGFYRVYLAVNDRVKQLEDEIKLLKENQNVG